MTIESYCLSVVTAENGVRFCHSCSSIWNAEVVRTVPIGREFAISGVSVTNPRTISLRLSFATLSWMTAPLSMG
jgi:hypothetical protein